MQETKDTTLTNRSLRNDFRTICEVQMRNSLQRIDCPKKLIDELFAEMVSRVINTMMNSLLQCAAMVSRIESNKGVDADIALRDKLKVYASEKGACIKLQENSVMLLCIPDY